jgi:hypothetical protein
MKDVKHKLGFSKAGFANAKPSESKMAAGSAVKSDPQSPAKLGKNHY